MEKATFGAGCFWCVEAVFLRLKGVNKVISGYTGGKTLNPTYDEICSGTTGHAEVIQISFDAEKVSFADLLEIFWHSHDPTTLNRQGNDVGTQYRSAIFYENETQRQIAETSLINTNASGLWPKPIVTEIKPLTVFYSAEDYHQNFYEKNPNQPYCSFAIPPKLRKLEAKFGDRLKPA
jgi:peptide-methionine (S)-S-oxide reductase